MTPSPIFAIGGLTLDPGLAAVLAGVVGGLVAVVVAWTNRRTQDRSVFMSETGTVIEVLRQDYDRVRAERDEALRDLQNCLEDRPSTRA